MLVGMMRNYKNPTLLAKLIAMNCCYYGVDFIYFRPDDVDMTYNSVKGKVFKGGKWQVVEKPIPDFIDVTKYVFKHKEVVNYLKKVTTLSDNGQQMVNKEILYKHLEQDPDLKDIIIPSKVYEEKKDLMEFLDLYNEIILKPIDGQKGKGIKYIKKVGNEYELLFQKHSKQLSYYELIDYLNNLPNVNDFVIQKYIRAKTKEDVPFDCRVHMNKDHSGEWQIAKKYMRVGLGQRILSNLSQGGGVVNSKNFLKANYGTNWEFINEELTRLSFELSKKVEVIRDQNLMSLGIDFGIDKNGKIYVFETNSSPGVQFIEANVALLRAQYYRYIIGRLKNKI
ncbi:YheC/YheD family protein [Alkalibacillus haloalkaliphilus]|uniref:ATP-grasp domain-containing protein n=1 Tax=Alkalibacillus haloalkaliphilus TaxID=94136 RepID=A0A511VZL2_9BACI|nr:YheC/YheD family protein [Alkalibacillus haloalkaliphilus]GEN44225.1 hypothetical protein AHA02nite_00010 [Alkalibacillus haloalkaliphilus]